MRKGAKTDDPPLGLSAYYAYQQTQKSTIETQEHTITELQQVVAAQQKAIAHLSQMIKNLHDELDGAKASLKACECKDIDKTTGNIRMLRCAHAICLACVAKLQAEQKQTACEA